MVLFLLCDLVFRKCSFTYFLIFSIDEVVYPVRLYYSGFSCDSIFYMNLVSLVLIF